MAPYIGTPTSRVDGLAKVTGAAKYAAEFNVPGLVYGQSFPPRYREGTHHAHRCKRGPERRGRDRRADARESSAPWPPPIKHIKTTWRPQDRHSARSTTARSCSAATDRARRRGRSRKSRASPHPWCAWPTRRKHPSRICSSRRGQAFPLEPEAFRSRRCSRRRSRAVMPRETLAAAAVRHDSRILHSGRASQSDGALCFDSDLGRRRQAHGLRQDARRAKRPALSVQRVWLEAGGCACPLAVRGRRVWLGAAPAISSRHWQCLRPCALERSGAARADADSKCTGSAAARPRSSAWLLAPRRTARLRR